ncbi:MAG: putative damage-inducible protein DinB [Arcticibacterium sp.]|jgi:uncharacterized damage-inducible protein DinB
MITFIEAFKSELADEAKETKRMLEKVPMDKFDWQPHTRSMKLGVLAYHLAELPHMISKALLKDKWDFAEEEPVDAKSFETNEALLVVFENAVKDAMDALEVSSDDILLDKWKLCAGEITYLEIEKWEAVRHALGQNAHHRAQLGVFLRLLNLPIPGPYGPSADEM